MYERYLLPCRLQVREVFFMMQTGFHIIWLKMSPNSWFFPFFFSPGG